MWVSLKPRRRRPAEPPQPDRDPPAGEQLTADAGTAAADAQPQGATHLPRGPSALESDRH